MDSYTAPHVLWRPDAAFREKSRMTQFAHWLEKRTHLHFPDYDTLWQFSINEPAAFWRALVDFFEVAISGDPKTAMVPGPEGILGTQWFPETRLSYAHHIFRNANPDHPALLFSGEEQHMASLSWAELEQSVGALAQWLRNQGVGVGDRVAGYVSNTPHAVIAFLAANSLGAIWSSCSPDFGTASVVERFQQIAPKVLFAADGYRYNGRLFDRSEEIREIAAAMPGLSSLVVIPVQQTSQLPVLEEVGVVFWEQAIEEPAPLSFTEVPFAHPIWILFSSGTTGKPKAIMHSTGGILLEHLKALALHQDCHRGERFFWYSTTGWMMWNYLVGALLVGGVPVLYDGSAGSPDLGVLWRMAQEAAVQHFGGGAAFYIACMKAAQSIIPEGGFPALRSIGSTGSPLPAEAFEWIYAAIKPDVWLISLSGGTDVCSGFVGGSPWLPVHAGEIQCRMLGCELEAFGENGEPIREDLGEMVILKAMPSMPVGFWNDSENERYRSSYFEMYPGIWRHGDWVRITDRGTVIIYGRSDATLNRGGVRIGTAEVYSGVETLPEVKDSLALSLELPGGAYFMPLFVVLAEGVVFDEKLKTSISRNLRSRYSPRHVPDEIFEVKAIPYTISGKKMEAPIKRILLGAQPAQVASPDAMRNPESLQFFVDFFQNYMVALLSKEK